MSSTGATSKDPIYPTNIMDVEEGTRKSSLTHIYQSLTPPPLTSSPLKDDKESNNNYSNLKDHHVDASSSCSGSSSGFGSYPDLQSQTDFCPNTNTAMGKDKDSYLSYSSSSGVGDSMSNVGVEDVEKKGGTKKKVKMEKEYTGIKRYGGMLLTLLASLSFSFVTLIVKILNKDYGVDAYGSSFWRYVGITVPAFFILVYCEWGPGGKDVKAKGLKGKGRPGSIFDTVWPLSHGDNWKTFIGLVGRGIIGSTSVILRYYALQYLTIGDTSVITYSTPVLVTVMAHFCLGERCGVVSVIIAFTTLAGVIIVTKPPLLTGAESFDTDTLIGTGLACGSLFCASILVIVTRKIREVHFALMVFTVGVIGVIQAAVMAFTLGHGHLDIPSHLYDTLYTAGVAVLSFVGQMAIILALKFEQAGPVALLRSCDVVFGFMLQFLFLDVVPDAWSGVGALIVLLGVIITASRKWIGSLNPETSCIRRAFGWILF